MKSNLSSRIMPILKKDPDILDKFSEQEVLHLQNLTIQKVWQRIQRFEQKPQTPVVPLYKKTWVRAAAAVLILISAAIWYWQTDKKAITTGKSISLVQDILPGKTEQWLTLAEGKKVILDNAGNGSLGMQGGAGIIKTKENIAYHISDKKSGEIIYNTLTTSRAQTYSITLSEGTKVWLNAESSITFPAVFTTNERRVKITGEVYFEVAKNKQAPFYVQFDQNEIKVLGTHFNVNTYKTETSVKTTLLEGSIQFSTNGKQQLLIPGEQVQVANGNIKLVKDVNTENVIAWKNGFFLI